MPHDARGHLLKVGDEVVLRGKVKSINSEQPTYCNITLQTHQGMEPSQDGEGGGQTYALSARMVELETPPPQAPQPPGGES